MKITLYTITSCEFSKQEKTYLASHNLPYEEKNLETNKDFLTEMLAISNNFAGTPVTKIEKDDGKIIVLKGFTKEEFDTVLGFAPAQTVTPPKTEPIIVQQPVVEPPVVQAPPPVTPTPQVVPDVPAMPPTMEPPKPEPLPPMPTPPEPTPTPSVPTMDTTPPVMPPIEQVPDTQNMTPQVTPPSVVPSVPSPIEPSQTDALDAILNDLQTKANQTVTPPPPTPPQQ